MLARCEFRNYAPIRLMRGNLRRHHVRDKSLSRAHHSRSSFVTGTFNAENVSVGHETIVLDLCQYVHLSVSSFAAEFERTFEPDNWRMRASGSAPPSLEPALCSGDSRGFHPVARAHLADGFGKIISYRAFGEAKLGGYISTLHAFAGQA